MIDPCSIFAEVTATVELHKRIIVNRIPQNSAVKKIEFDAFLSKFYCENGQNYLLSKYQQEVDLRIGSDARSMVFVARNNDGRIESGLRITPSPFEFPQIIESAKALEGHLKNHVEFSRLISLSSSGNFAASAVMAEACRWACINGYSGVVALARDAQRRYFSKFGLIPATQNAFHIPERDNGLYWLLKGDWATIAVATERFLDRHIKLSELCV